MNPSSRRGVKWDHPRRCGENWAWRGSALTPAGSPPQVRGKLNRWAVCRFLCRITPAGAGKTPAVTARNTNAAGSPPQVRGKPHRPKERGGTPGITPAGAGKTERPAGDSPAPRDHPRRCGENFRNNPVAKDIPGSPPQVRGKPIMLLLLTIPNRITPAGAGKTLAGVFYDCNI